MSAHDFEFTSITGDPMPLSGFKGKTVLVVNTASACGLTPQYEGLQALHEKHGDAGLVVLGVPANDFGGQEPGTEEEIQNFCTTKFSVTFPMTQKQTVIGGDAHPFYKWIVDELGEDSAPKWNFHKYLIGPDGDLLGTFGSRMEPSDAELGTAIEASIGS